MGDGGVLKEGGMMISTNNFTKQEVELLIRILWEKFSILTTLRQAKKDESTSYWLIYVPSYSLPLFTDLIQDHMVPSMLYKLSIERQKSLEAQRESQIVYIYTREGFVSQAANNVEAAKIIGCVSNALTGIINTGFPVYNKFAIFSYLLPVNANLEEIINIGKAKGKPKSLGGQDRLNSWKLYIYDKDGKFLRVVNNSKEASKFLNWSSSKVLRKIDITPPEEGEYRVSRKC